MEARRKVFFLCLLKSFFQKKYYMRKKRREFILRMISENNYRKMRIQRLFVLNILRHVMFSLRSPKNVWAFDRFEFWFEERLNRNNINFEGRWREDFRMKGSTLSDIVTLMRPHMEKQFVELEVIWLLDSPTFDCGYQ